MKHIKMAVGGLCLAALAACQAPQVQAPPPAVQPIEKYLGDADNALRAGRSEEAISILRKATEQHDTDKTAWLRLAQIRFDQSNYGEAITYSTEALKREPDNLLASSIIAVSGLRVTSKSLADLSNRNNLTGNVKSEAEELAELLRGAIGERRLVEKPKTTGGPRMKTTTAANPPAKGGSALDILK